MKECCGRPIETPYCPNCGMEHGAGAKNEIKRFIEGKLNQLKSTQKSNLKWDEDHPDRSTEYRREQKRASMAFKIAKFQKWVDYIDSLAP